MCFVMVFIHVFNPAAIINKHNSSEYDSKEVRMVVSGF